MWKKVIYTGWFNDTFEANRQRVILLSFEIQLKRESKQ